MRRAFLLLGFAAAAAAAPGKTAGQVPAEPVLRGRVLLQDSLLRTGTVVLHRVATESQGEVDSARVASDGSFSFRLPSVPDPERSEIYFASVRHAGILYFGKAVTLPVQLDSLYEIQTYDTLMAPAGGARVPVQARNVFFEAGPDGAWQVTDLFQLRSDETRTLVAREGDVVWRHALPPSATGATVAQADFASAGAEIREGELAVTSPLPPGERLFVVRYAVDDPFLSLPVVGRTELLEILAQEPSPPLQGPGLERGQPVELEEGVTFQRLLGAHLEDTTLQLTEARGPGRPPVGWVALVLSLVLAGVGTWAVQRGAAPAPTPRRPVEAMDRGTLIVEVARLDEAFEARDDPTPEERGAYEARRRALLRRLAELG